ncbi:hypothetical protein [Paenibacillus silvisoli]|uniref:hypothetical protein n=1 Tax=Paenibacillus silvisoli TaxID=3110539 RepID=UPI002803AF4E|nr:hypothetical protein [Paenibacillus silvisoli]
MASAIPLLITYAAAQDYTVFEEVVAPYFKQWGIACDRLEAIEPEQEADLSAWPLIVLAHPGCLAGSAPWLAARIQQAVKAGTGLISFGEPIEPYMRADGELRHAKSIAIREAEHPICRLHGRGEKKLHYVLSGSGIKGTAAPSAGGGCEHLVTMDGQPLLSVRDCGAGGRFAGWSTLEWGRRDALGPLYGLDDLLWRSIVWAARKPFVMRCLPPFVTMRVDDVSGFGRRFGGPSPFFWLQDCVELGWKPWLGLFLDDLQGEAIGELEPTLRRNEATACPHSFSYWDFIYFRHSPKYPDEGYWSEAAVCEPYTESEISDRARRVDDWYAKHPEVPVSRVFTPHYYELSAGFMPHLLRWGAEFICSMNPVGEPYAGIMSRGEPYFAATKPLTPTTPVFYADWFPAEDEQYRRALFASVTEIRDENGYEWSPNNDVEASIMHGVNQLLRALDAKVLAQLFTHESGYIQYVKPENWRAIMNGVTEAVKREGVIHATLDDAMAYLRDLHESRLIQAECSADGALVVSFEGISKGASKIAVYRDDALMPEWHDIEPFNSGTVSRIHSGQG